MKKIILLSILFLFIFSIENIVFAQNRCKDYVVKKCKFHKNSDFQYSWQSRSSEFYKGWNSTFKINVWNGFDYHFAICYNKELGNVQFKITEDNNDKTLIYDNLTDNYAKDVVLTMGLAKTLIIEIIIPGEGSEIKPDSQRYCVGVLVEYMKKPKTGF
jgi:hypothetical protein